MSEHPTMERLNDLLDGLLDADEAADVRAHLDGCAGCRLEHERLAAIVASLRALPGGARPPMEAWAGVAARLASGHAGRRPSTGADVVPLPVARAARPRSSVSLPLAAAAAVVLSVLSAGTVFWTMSSGEPAGGDLTAPQTADGAPLPASSMPALAVGEYDRAVTRLQDVVEQGRDVLAPETLETLERSLRTIDRALADVRAALVEDPSSELLGKLLVSHQRAKLRLLRQAAISVQAAS